MNVCKYVDITKTMWTSFAMRINQFATCTKDKYDANVS